MNLRIKSIIIIYINRSNNGCNRINTSNGKVSSVSNIIIPWYLK